MIWTVKENPAQYPKPGLGKMLNPVWWFMNDREPNPMPWYTRGKFAWYLRNPFQNFGWFVIGYGATAFRYFEGPPVGTYVLADIQVEGVKRGWLQGGWFWLPYYSYTGKVWVFYIGWQPSGFAGVKINRRNSSFQVV